MIQLLNVGVEYPNHTAIKNLTTQFELGKVYGLVGPNGAGKSTLLKVLSGLLDISRGELTIDSKSWVTHPKEINATIGFMPEVFNSYDSMTPREFLEYFRRLYMKSEEANLENLLSDNWLLDFQKKKNSELSRGMKQRLVFAKTLVHNPSWIFLDEPASGLDPQGRLEFRRLVKSMRSQHRGILISSHILEDLQDICDEVLFFEKGELVHKMDLASRESFGDRSFENENRKNINREIERGEQLIEPQSGTSTKHSPMDSQFVKAAGGSLSNTTLGLSQIQLKTLSSENELMKILGDDLLVERVEENTFVLSYKKEVHQAQSILKKLIVADCIILQWDVTPSLQSFYLSKRSK